MRRWFALLILVCILSGCTSARIPVYLKDDKPYVKRYYSGYSQTLASVEQVLDEFGWQVDRKLDPLMYEQDRDDGLINDDILLVSNTRQASFFIGTRYSKLNVFVRSKDDQSEVEIRFLSVTSMPIKNFQTYSNDAVVERLFGRLDELLVGDSM